MVNLSKKNILLSTVTARYLKASDNSVVKELFFQILNAAWMKQTNWNKKKSWWKTSVKMPLKKSVKWLKRVLKMKMNNARSKNSYLLD